MPRKTLFMSIALALLSACANGPKTGGAIPAIDARGIRDLGSGPFLLDFLAIKAGTEDRVVLEYDIDKLGRRVDRIVLKVPVYNLDKDGEAGIIDVFTFVGDGEVTAGEFYAGEPLGQVAAGENRFVRVDVTPAVNAALTEGRRFIGFRLSTETADRYFLGGIVDLLDPTLRSRRVD
jgi:hypothetical protein